MKTGETTVAKPAGDCTKTGMPAMKTPHQMITSPKKLGWREYFQSPRSHTFLLFAGSERKGVLVQVGHRLQHAAHHDEGPAHPVERADRRHLGERDGVDVDHRRRDDEDPEHLPHPEDEEDEAALADGVEARVLAALEHAVEEEGGRRRAATRRRAR